MNQIIDNLLPMGRHVVIYGAGSTGYYVHALLTTKLKNVIIDAFCDTFKTGVDRATGLKIIIPDDLINYTNAIIIIGVSDYLKLKDVYEIEKILENNFFPREQILRYSQFCSLFQNFDNTEFDWQQYGDNLYNFDTNVKLITNLANYISEQDKSVVDLGAGNMNLRKFISSEIKYYPVDFKLRSDETIVCDFNKDEFPDINADVYVLCAILYYINNPISLLEKCGRFATKKIIIALSNRNLTDSPEIMHVHGLKNYMYFDEIEVLLKKYDFIPSNDVSIEDVARRFVVYEKT